MKALYSSSYTQREELRLADTREPPYFHFHWPLGVPNPFLPELWPSGPCQAGLLSLSHEVSFFRATTLAGLSSQVHENSHPRCEGFNPIHGRGEQTCAVKSNIITGPAMAHPQAQLGGLLLSSRGAVFEGLESISRHSD